MKTREMTIDDLRCAIGWMRRRYGGEMPEEFFPKTGVAACRNDGKLLVVIPVYFEETSSTAVAGHCMACPENSPRESRLAVESAMREVVRYAAARGRRFLVAIYGKRSVNRIADRIGFRNGDIVEEKFLSLR